MASRDDLLAFLAAHGIEQTTYDHPAVFTVGESGAIKQKIRPKSARRYWRKARDSWVFCGALPRAKLFGVGAVDSASMARQYRRR